MASSPSLNRRRRTSPRCSDRADAALIIGDPALQLDPATLPYHVADLGQEWTDMTGLPMVFAVWAGAQAAHHARRCRSADRILPLSAASTWTTSCKIDGAARGIPEALVREYLTRHIVNELGPEEYGRTAISICATRARSWSPYDFASGSHRSVRVRRPDRHRHGRRRRPPQAASRRRRQLHHRPQHQLHQLLHRVLQLLRVLPPDGPRGRLHPAARK